MKKQLSKFQVLLFLIFLPIFAKAAVNENLTSPEACEGNVTLTTQAEVNTFNCTAFEGNLTISGPDITNLDSLSDLVSVSGKFTISNNPILQDIKGLTSVTWVGSLAISSNDSLVNLNGLFNLDSIAENLSIKNNGSLININGLGPVRNLMNLEVSNNALLQNVDGLDKLQKADVLLINFNTSLTNVDGLSNLLSLTHMQITMTGNTAMQNCCGLYNLWTSGTVYGVIDIENNGASCNREDVIFACDPNATKCFATAVVSYNPGTTKDGRPVAFERAFPKKALGTPQENDNLNFVALGFGGTITLRLGDDLSDDGTTAPEFILVETSYGLSSALCYENGTYNNPESAFVELSSDGSIWYSLPNLQCRTTFIDISPAMEAGLAFARFIRITDASNPNYFVGESDGFDVDGLIICEEEVQAGLDRLTDARTASRGIYNPNFFNSEPNEVKTSGAIQVYPNPAVNDNLLVEFDSEDTERVRIEIIDLNGKRLMSRSFDSTIGKNRLELNVQGLASGQYFIAIQLKSKKLVEKIIIE